MNSPSSPKDLATLPSGTRIFIDANIFIYHFTQVPLTAACTAFLQRVEAEDLDVASNDPDLTTVPDLTVWRPQP